MAQGPVSTDPRFEVGGSGAQPTTHLVAHEFVTQEVEAPLGGIVPNEATDEALSTLMTMLSHELRSPVHALAINVGSCLDRLRGPGDVPREWLMEKLYRQRKAVGRLRHLIDTFLDVAQISAGTLPLNLEELDLRQLTRDVVRRVAEDFAWAGSPCEVRALGPVVGQWDALQLDLVITNLVSNAMKYGCGRPIYVDVWGTAEAGCLRVRDDGEGIPKADQQRIFEKFVRLPSQTRVGGFGLGLWIVKNVVEMMDGEVEVASEGGRGSAFTVTLPR
jgi:signal transduction histidine kinase